MGRIKLSQLAITKAKFRFQSLSWGDAEAIAATGPAAAKPPGHNARDSRL